MIKNYFKIFFRNVVRHKAFAVINIAGLAIGMACSIFILLWVQHELSYDRFHKNAKSIYRIAVSYADVKAVVSSGPLAPALQDEDPAVERVVRMKGYDRHMFAAGNRKFEEEHTFYADTGFLQMFSFPLVKGDPATALERPDAILLTETMAKKYFGDEDALGRVLQMDNKKEVVVTGILKDLPANTHLQFDLLMPMSAILKTDENLKIWDNLNYFSYIQLNENFKAGPDALADIGLQLDRIYNEHVGGTKVRFFLQPVTSIHLHSSLLGDLPGGGNVNYMNIFFAVAFFIMAVACINFMNLATARSARRAKEVGMRKVAGAKRRQLIAQFISESLFITFIALIIALLLVWLLLPGFNHIAGKQFSMNILDGKMMLMLAGIAAFTGIVSGSYPALFLSNFKPVNVLKGNMKVSGGNLMFRNSLVVLQFIISIVLLAGTVIVYQQLRYIKNKNLGFEKSNLLYLPMTGDMFKNQKAMKTELRQNTLTNDFCITGDLPMNLLNTTGSVDWSGKAPNAEVPFVNMDADEDFLNVYQVGLVAGRYFSNDFHADSNNYVINQKAMQVIGLKTPDEAIGKALSLWDIKGTIIGVVRDFNFKPLQHSIDPLIIRRNRGSGFITVRTKPGATEATIKTLEKICAKMNPAYPFSFGFFDQELAASYKGEQQMGDLINVFALLAVFISCMGLYGLSAFMTEQRAREIGVRKVLGATVLDVVYLLSTNFVKLILIAAGIAIPIAWYTLDGWLKGFAYRVNLNLWVFLAASLVALVIAWITISYESVKAAISNPVKALRSE